MSTLSGICLHVVLAKDDKLSSSSTFIFIFISFVSLGKVFYRRIRDLDLNLANTKSQLMSKLDDKDQLS